MWDLLHVGYTVDIGRDRRGVTEKSAEWQEALGMNDPNVNA